MSSLLSPSTTYACSGYTPCSTVDQLRVDAELHDIFGLAFRASLVSATSYEYLRIRREST